MRGAAKSLFAEFEKDCAANEINQYYLIRSEQPAAKAFYDKFSNASTEYTPVLRKNIKP